jgi:type II secretory pathway pseudopilin PulG
MGASSRNRGFTYVWMLAVVAVMGIGLAAMGTMHGDRVRRDREQELLRVGQIYASAIAAYYRMSPGGQKQYPASLDALVLDTRFVGTVRHMRKVYADPVDPAQPWGLVRATDGGIAGVFSTSINEPLRREPLQLDRISLPRASHYAEWRFIASVEP